MGKISQTLIEQSSQECAYIKIYNELDAEDALAISDAQEEGVSAYAIANALSTGGYKIAQSTIAQHVKGRCRCK